MRVNGIKESGITLARWHDWRRGSYCWWQWERATKVETYTSKGVCTIDFVADLRSRKIVKNTKSSAKYRLPFLAPTDLKSYAHARGETAVRSVVGPCSGRRQSQVRQIVYVETRHSRKTRPIERLRREIQIPSQAVRKSKTGNDAPSVLRIRTKIPEQECRIELGRYDAKEEISVRRGRYISKKCVL